MRIHKLSPYNPYNSNDAEKTPSEIQKIAQLIHNLWQQEYRHILDNNYLDQMSLEERYQGILKRYRENHSEFLLMHDGDRFIGVAVLGKSFTEGYLDDGEISALYLHRDYHGQGYGHKLLVKSEQFLAARGNANFVLDVFTNNRQALEFYLKHGYREVDQRLFPFGSKEYPLVVMRKKNPLTIRQETPNDYLDVYQLTKAAFFGLAITDGDEQDIAVGLRKRESFIPSLSLVAELDGQLVGHILFTKITVGGKPALCLGPLAILPEKQQQAIGNALIRRGHEVAERLGFSACILVGHPEYYPRFGYELASKHNITMPFDAPDECVMVRFLGEQVEPLVGEAAFPPELMPKT
jgi:predicted N-acetyltransferase YhbS